MRYAFLCFFIFCSAILLSGCGEDTEEDAEDEILGYQQEIGQLEQKISVLEANLSECQQDLYKCGQSSELALVKGTITINPGLYHDYRFEVTSNMKNPRIVGSFEAVSGGALYVYLFDKTNFLNWDAGGDSRTIYASGKVVTAQIDVSIPTPGTYHLIFSNRISWITSKTVDAAVEFQYGI